MTTPAQPAGPAQQGPPPKPERAELARVWAKALISTTYVPTSRPDIEHLLRDLLDRLVGSLVGGVTNQGLPPDAAREVGGRLIAAHFTSEQSLSHTMELLGQALGVAIAMLGCSGAGAVAHLEDLPVGTVELAPQIVRRVAVRGCGSAVARSVPSLVEQLRAGGATVMVRGLDTRDQAEWWRSAGADVGQGAFLAPPGPPEAIVAPPPGV